MSSSRQASISFGPPLTRVVKILIISTSSAFVVCYLLLRLFGWAAPYVWFGLSPYQVTRQFSLWQLVTYLFLHDPDNLFHIIFNMLALWMFGSDLEGLWGPRRFLFYYFLTGVGAGLFDVAFQPSRMMPTVGCSGAVYGLLLAYGLLFPDRPIFLWLILPIKAKWFVVIMGAIELLSSLGGGASRISHVAHLGGMLFGFLFLRGGGLTYGLQLRYHEWRRVRLRRKFETYMRKQERKDDAGRWIH